MRWREDNRHERSRTNDNSLDSFCRGCSSINHHQGKTIQYGALFRYWAMTGANEKYRLPASFVFLKLTYFRFLISSQPELVLKLLEMDEPHVTEFIVKHDKADLVWAGRETVSMLSQCLSVPIESLIIEASDLYSFKAYH